MKIICSLCISLIGFINPEDPVIYSLFYHWNKMSLALAKEIPSGKNAEEKMLYQERLQSFCRLWNMVPDSLQNTSLRWRFLERISTEFNWKDKKWSVIEMIRSGEITRVDNYLVFYHGRMAHIIAYRYETDKWVKMREWQQHIKTSSLVIKSATGTAKQGCNNGDVIVTDFKSALPLQVAYFAEYMVPRGSEAGRMICRSR
ncbi:hypothetical protein ACTJJB_24670 [Chitinophaga sp. 22536]|uniref:hypothetical protein n=1 Tax=unclassified Chitinophaga TaxID=2619133 RepID=UPI003F8449DE